MTMRTFGTAALAAASLLFAACAGGGANARKSPAGAVPLPVSTSTETARTAAAEPDVRDMNLRPIPGAKAIRFDYDSDELDESARAALRANAEIFKARPDMKVQVAGHCDQRGTVAYNLALGQRRAKVVKDYYMIFGVEGDRIATISWGKERPLCSKASESCWSSNRRAETLEAIGVKSAVP